MLKEGFKQSLKYLKESMNFVYAIMIIFFGFVLIGFFLPVPTYIEEQILEYIRELMEMTQGMSTGELTRFIFFNNLQSSFFGMMLGAFFGFFSILFSIFNGYVLGFVGAMSVQEEGALVLWRLLPHGIFELPAIFISLGLGLKFGTFILQKERVKYFKEYFWNSLRVFIFIVIPLLIIAAIIEGVLIAISG